MYYMDCFCKGNASLMLYIQILYLLFLVNLFLFNQRVTDQYSLSTRTSLAYTRATAPIQYSFSGEKY